MNSSKQTLTLVESTRQFIVGALLLVSVYLSLACASSMTKRPWADEAIYANTAYNLAFHGRMNATVFVLGRVWPESLAQRNYSQPPLYFIATAAWFKLIGFGIFRLRLLATLWGLIALFAWYVIARKTGASPIESLIVTAFVSLDYFFLIGASDGRMDMMCNALGTAAIAVYLYYRERNLTAAMAGANTLVVASGLTHPVGIIYLFGLLFLIVYFDRKLLSWRLLIVAILPYIVGAALWGSYIAQDPRAFLEQFLANAEGNRRAAGISGGFSLLGTLQQEILRRYIAPFGLGPGMPLMNRTKGIVLIAYCSGLLAIALIPKLRRQRPIFALLVLTLIYFIVLTYISPSKRYYYLPFVTMPMAACLALSLLRLDSSRARRFAAYGVLAAVATVQLAGTLYRIRQDPYHRSYLPLIRVIDQNSPEGALVAGETGIWFGLTPQRTLVEDATLGCFKGNKPDLFVIEPLFQQLLKEISSEYPKDYECAVTRLQYSQNIYSDGYYTLYRPGR